MNTATGETTWELPEDDGADGAEDHGARPPTPPRPWKTMEHPDAPGEWYYLNEDTGETCWDLPDNTSSSADVERENPNEIQPDNCPDSMGDTAVEDAPIRDEAVCEESKVDNGKNMVDDNESTCLLATSAETTTEAEVTGLINDTVSEAVAVATHESDGLTKD